jgi:hypothetical protein
MEGAIGVGRTALNTDASSWRYLGMIDRVLFHSLLYLLLLATMLAGLFITLLNLPGLWVMFLAAGIYAWATHGIFLGYRSLIAIGVIALLAEIVEFFAATAGAKRAGASRGGRARRGHFFHRPHPHSDRRANRRRLRRNISRSRSG